MNGTNNDPDRDAVMRRLESLGFMVRPIPENNKSPSPDIVAETDRERMYVEVKNRSQDQTLREKMESVKIGSTENIPTGLGKHNTISGEIKQANKQLSAVAAPNDFRLLWYRADTGPFTHNTKEQIVSTLYGMRMAITESPAFGATKSYCAYADNADFHRFQEIDGVIVEEDGLITLFLNPFSPRRKNFASSKIATIINDSVFDVEKAISQGKIFAADGNAPRKDEKQLLKHLSTKYPETKFIQFIKPHSYTIMTTIDGSEDL